MIRRIWNVVTTVLSVALLVGVLLSLIWTASLMGLVDTGGVDSPVVDDIVDPPQWFVDSPLIRDVPSTGETPAPTGTPDAPSNSSPPEGDPGTTSTGDVTSDEIEDEIHERINEIRTERGLSELDYDEEIATIARIHSQDMNQREYFSHVNPEGEGPGDRFGDLFPRECRAVGENIAYIKTGFGRYGSAKAIAERIVEGWMNSEGHRENILRENWDSEGIGVYIGDDGRIDATQNFCEAT